MTQILRVLDLFSGIGGMSLGLEMTGGFRTVAFCERDAYCKSILRQHWPTTPIYGDVKELNYDQPVDVICGGYPCQPFSQAGKRRGDQDDRHLWPEMARIIDETRPTWVLAENVAGHVSLGLDQVLSDLEARNYTWGAYIIPAVAVNAHHRRDRVWIIAHSDGKGEPDVAVDEKPRSRQLDVADANGKGSHGTHNHQKLPARFQQEFTKRDSQVAADPIGEGSQSAGHEQREARNARARQPFKLGSGQARLWETEPVVGRVAHGVSARVDRIKALGNSVVPQVVAQIGRAILEAHYGDA